MRWRTARSRCSCCSRAPCSPAGDVGVRGRAALVVDRRRSYRLPVAVWRGVMDLYFPEQRLGPGPSRRRSTGSSASGPTRGVADVGPGLRAAPQGGRGGAPMSAPARDPPRLRASGPLRGGRCRGRRRPLRGVRPVPVPGLVAARTRCAGSSACSTPRAFSEADGSERWSMRTECLVDAGRRAPRPHASASAACRRSTGRSRCAVGSGRVDRVRAAGRPARSADGSHVEWDEAVDRVVDLPTSPLVTLEAAGARRARSRSPVATSRNR